jgi:uncharacterized protein YndB with AHSA1/START domain
MRAPRRGATTTRLRQHVNAPRDSVYRALVDARAVAIWMVEMTVTFTLSDAGHGTDVPGVHYNLPPGIAHADNEAGWRMAVEKLAALVETSA